MTFISGTRGLALVLGLLPAALQAQTNVYGGYDIVGPASASEAYYGEARDWTVRAGYPGGSFGYCVAEYTRDGYQVLAGWDGMQWQVAVPIAARGDWEGEFRVDGRGHGNGGGAQMSGVSTGDWSIAWLGMSELDGLRQGNEAMVSVGKFDYVFPLRGSAAAILKVEECVGRRGIPAAAAAPGGVRTTTTASPQTPQSPASPAMPQRPATPMGGGNVCEGHLFPRYDCVVTQLTPEPGYSSTVEVRDPSGGNFGWFVKVIDRDQAEVWVDYNDGSSWRYLGFFRPETPGSDCLVPISDGSVTQHPDAIANQGHDDWHFCVR